MGSLTSSVFPKVHFAKIQSSSSSVLQAKVIFLGDAGVGKSSIILRCKKNIFFKDHELTIGVDYSKQTFILNNNMTITLNFWEMEGGERFKAIVHNTHFRDANAAVLVYELCNSDSFNRMKYWLNQLDSVVKIKNFIILMVGNKCDLPENEQTISKSTAEKFANENKLIFIRTSAKNGDGIEVMLQMLAEEIYKKIEKK